MGPSVRNLLSQYKLDPSQIATTGPHSTLLKSDVLSYIEQQKLTPSTSQATFGASQRAQSTLSVATKPSTSSTNLPKPIVQHISNECLLAKKYARKRPEQLEIDVINNGGRLDI